MLSCRSMVLAFALLVPACSAPPDEDADAPGTSTGAVTTGRGRDLRCSTTIEGVSRTLRFELGPVGAPGRVRMVRPSLQSTVSAVALERAGDDVLVHVRDPQGGPLATLRMPGTLWNDPGRAATENGLPMYQDPWFEADVVSVVGPSWTKPRCELEFIPSPPGVSDDLIIEGDDAARLFDAMNVPLQGSQGRTETTSGERPYGTKMIEGRGFWRLECSHRPPVDVPIAGVPSEPARLVCSFKMVAHVASRGPDLTTYAMTLTEREKAGRLFVAFESLPLADGVGFEVQGLVASGYRGRGPVPGSRLRVACKDVGDYKTTCDVTLVAPPNP